MAFTGHIEMIHPDGGLVRIPHGSDDMDKQVIRYKKKGFKLPEEAARDAELESLRKQVAGKKGA